MKTCTIEGCERTHAARGLCAKHYNYEWKRENRARVRDYQNAWYARTQYGLTLEQCRARNDFSCRICGRTGMRMVIDHDHESGELRSALCSNCNSGLGLFGENADILRAAAKYIEEYRAPKESEK